MQIIPGILIQTAWVIQSLPHQGTKHFKEHKFDMHFSIAKSCAEMVAKDDPEMFLDVMNNFLVNNGLSPVTMLHSNNKPISTTINNWSVPTATYSPLLFSEITSTRHSDTSILNASEQSVRPISSVEDQSSMNCNIRTTSPTNDINSNKTNAGCPDSPSQLSLDSVDIPLSHKFIISQGVNPDSPPQLHILAGFHYFKYHPTLIKTTGQPKTLQIVKPT